MLFFFLSFHICFTDETLKILRQIENQLVAPSPYQPTSVQMAKREIPELPDAQELVQMLEKIQRKLLI